MKVKRDLRSEKYFYKKSGAIPHFFYAKNLPIYCNLQGFFLCYDTTKTFKNPRRRTYANKKNAKRV